VAKLQNRISGLKTGMFFKKIPKFSKFFGKIQKNCKKLEKFHNVFSQQQLKSVKIWVICG